MLCSSKKCALRRELNSHDAASRELQVPRRRASSASCSSLSRSSRPTSLLSGGGRIAEVCAMLCRPASECARPGDDDGSHHW